MTAGSTWALRTPLDLEGLNAHLDALEQAGLLGIVEEGGVATAYFPARVDGLPVGGRWEPVPDVDWAAHWRLHARVVRIGPLVVTPPWLLGEAAASAPPLDPIVIEPGQAFGTGEHETTQGCLAALCEIDCKGRSVLDVGCGSGVLAIAAARLGAARVVACDTDPLAVEAAQRNAEINAAAVEVRAGSTAVAEEPFDVVVANLDTDTITQLAADLVACLVPRGALVASGVSRERAGEAVAAFDAAGLPVLPRPGREWVVLTGRRLA